MAPVCGQGRGQLEPSRKMLPQPGALMCDVVLAALTFWQEASVSHQRWNLSKATHEHGSGLHAEFRRPVCRLQGMASRGRKRNQVY